MYGETVLNLIDLNRPAKSRDLGRRLPVVSLLCRISGFDVHFAGICFRLRGNVWELNGIKLDTKLKVYKAVVLPKVKGKQ